MKFGNDPCWHQETRYELTTSEWPVLIRLRVAGFEVTGDTVDLELAHLRKNLKATLSAEKLNKLKKEGLL